MERPTQNPEGEARETSRTRIRHTLDTIDVSALTPEERSLLKSLCDSLTPESTPSSETVPPHETSLESCVQDAFEIINTNQKLTFLVCAIGNVLNRPRGSTEGSQAFYFNVERKAMRETKHERRFLELDPNNVRDLFTDSYSVRKNDGYTYVAKRLNILPDTQNPFVTERRGGVHLTLVVRFKPEDIDSFKNKLIADELRAPSKEFFGPLFDHCARTYIPAYYTYIQQLSEAYWARHTPSQKAP